MYEILGSINEPKDIKKLNIKDLEKLSQDIRQALLNKVSKTGGHFGPNLGVVEATIALHYVFDSPKDKIVLDVSHQSYPHKMLTGRKEYFIEDDLLGKISGYASPKESIHDIFATGHTSTSISMALGLAKARDLRDEKYNILAFIGDGALSGGQALESLNIAGEYDKNLLIVVNDNEISIAENHGGLYKSLKDLRESKGESSNNIFKTFGLNYYYEENGNDIKSMIKILQNLKDVNKPTVLHIHTLKGKGYKFAEKDFENWHSSESFDLKTGKLLKSPSDTLTYKDITKSYIFNKAKNDKNFILITPAMPRSIGLDKEDRKKLGDQYCDTGIAEEACISIASGLAKNGAKPLVVTNATFMQRAYDQVSQDLSLNKSPATILLVKSGFEAARDMTHLGIFTIPIFSNIPNLVLLCPTCKNEFENMLDWSLDQKNHPVMILSPGNNINQRTSDSNFSDLNKFRVDPEQKRHRGHAQPRRPTGDRGQRDDGGHAGREGDGVPEGALHARQPGPVLRRRPVRVQGVVDLEQDEWIEGGHRLDRAQNRGHDPDDGEHLGDAGQSYSFDEHTYLVLLFSDALHKTKNLHIAGLSVAASLIQIFGYGAGFIRSFVDKIILRHGLEDLETLKKVYK